MPVDPRRGNLAKVGLSIDFANGRGIACHSPGLRHIRDQKIDAGQVQPELLGRADGEPRVVRVDLVKDCNRLAPGCNVRSLSQEDDLRFRDDRLRSQTLRCEQRLRLSIKNKPLQCSAGPMTAARVGILLVDQFRDRTSSISCHMSRNAFDCPEQFTLKDCQAIVAPCNMLLEQHFGRQLPGGLKGRAHRCCTSQSCRNATAAIKVSRFDHHRITKLLSGNNRRLSIFHDYLAWYGQTRLHEHCIAHGLASGHFGSDV